MPIRELWVTGDEMFLEPFVTGRKSFASHMAMFRRLEGIDNNIQGMGTSHVIAVIRHEPSQPEKD